MQSRVAKQKYKIFWMALALSFLIHISMVTSVSLFPTHWTNQRAKPKEEVSIEILDKSSVESKKPDPHLEEIKKAEQIVETNSPPDKNLNREATLLSEHNHKVAKETVAERIGAFRNSSKNSPKGQVNAKAKLTPQENETSAVAEPPLPPNIAVGEKVKSQSGFFPKIGADGIFARKNFANDQIKDELKKTPNKDTAQNQAQKTPPMNGPQPESDQQQMAGVEDPSQTQDFLKNKQKGIDTMLNTREFKYYSYYNRIRRQLSQHWEGKVRDKIMQIYKSGRTIASNQDHITKLLIILNSTGLLVNIKILGDSGVHDLDDAAIDAFRAAAPFPNPPRGIIETDGTVRIRWDMVLET